MPAPPAPRTDDDGAQLDLAGAVRDAGYRFVTVTPATHARVNARPGNEHARGLAGVFGWSRPFRPEVLPAPVFDLMRRAGMAVEERDGAWRSAVRLSTLDGEIFLHSAYPTTGADAVFFGPDTYRFASAVQVALAARGAAPVRRAVDVGCGAGPGGILVAKARPGAAVLMVDVNDEALRLARVNAALAGAPNAQPRRSDLLSAAGPGPFDLIVANPPYLLDPARRAYRHGGGALGEGLSVAILDAALDRLAPGGTLVLYTGAAVVDGRDAFRAAAERRLAGADLAWAYREVDPDVFGEELDEPAYRAADRIAAVVLTATRPGS
jgi:methylase of polypeptide subunit release factors